MMTEADGTTQSIKIFCSKITVKVVITADSIWQTIRNDTKLHASKCGTYS